MFSKFTAKADTSSTYIPIPHSHDLFIRLVHRSNEDDIVNDLSLKDLLEQACCADAASMVTFEATGYGSFLLWAAHVRGATTKNLDDALIASQYFIKRTSQRQVSIMINGDHSKHEGTSNVPNSSTLVVLARYDQKFASSLGLPLVLQNKTVWTHSTAKSRGLFIEPSILGFLLRRQLLCVLIFLSCVFAGLALSAKYFLVVHSSEKYHSWMAYDTHGSIGPKYQLSISGSNASAWTSSSVYKNGGWALRIDDQAIIPAHLMDDDEKKYQAWLQKEYPVMDRIRLNQDYLNETWLSSAATDQVPTDDLFHFSHCVLALRRYVKGKETGRHVCGRDIDHHHMRHCLDALDWWAFPKTGRMESFPNPKRPFGWRTKVCFE